MHPRFTRAAASLLIVLIGHSPLLAHDLENRSDGLTRIYDFSDALANFITVDSTGARVGIPNEFNGDAGIGFTVDRRDLVENGTDVAKVFHEHFRGRGPFKDVFHGTVVFTVFNGPEFEGDPILPPGPVTYLNYNNDLVPPFPDPNDPNDPNGIPKRDDYPKYSIVIDFSTVDPNEAGTLGADDRGLLLKKDWIFAYVIINDEGEFLSPGTPSLGNASIAFNQLSFVPGLRTEVTDVPQFPGTIGTTISAGGDVESELLMPTSDPALITFQSPGRGDPVAPLFMSIFYRFANGNLPDLSDRDAGGFRPVGSVGPSTENKATSNTIVLASPFGPGVSNISHTGGNLAASTDENVVLGPLTWPNLSCESATIKVDPPGPGLQTGEPNVRIVVTVRNPPPSNTVGPPYPTAPPGTQRGVYDVDLSVLEGRGFIKDISGPVRVTTEITDRVATAEFTARYLGGGTVRLLPFVQFVNPYTSPPFDVDPRFDIDDDRVTCNILVIVADPVLVIAKEVEFICFLDPNDPNQVELRAPAPDLPVPPCGLVRYTITVTNQTPGEAVGEIGVTDCLPNELIFRRASIPMGETPLAPNCAATGDTSRLVFPLPAPLDPNEAFVFTIEAIVRSDSPPGVKTNFARAVGRGLINGRTTQLAQDVASIEVRSIDGTLTAQPSTNPTACAGQTVTFTYRFTNTGTFPLDPVIIGECDADPGIQILSQVPKAGAAVRDLAVDDFFDLVVTAIVEEDATGMPCVRCSVNAQPDCYDPRDPEDCEFSREAEQCIEIASGQIVLTDLTPMRPCVDPGTEVTFPVLVENTGDSGFSSLEFFCEVDPNSPGLIILECPPPSGPLMPGANTTVNVRVRASEVQSDLQCVIVTVRGRADGLPTVCDATDTIVLCLGGRPRIDISHRVQLVCFLDPSDPSQRELRPPVAAAEVDAPVCGLVRFTVNATNPTPNEGLENVIVTVCLPAGLGFRDNVTPPLNTAGPGLPCGPGTTPFVFSLPNLAENGGTFSFTYDAIVIASTPSGMLDVLAQAEATGVESMKSAVESSAIATVDAKTVSAALDPGSVSPEDVLCPRQEVVFNYTFTNTGEWPLNPVTLMVELDPGLTKVDTVPSEGENSGPVLPGNSLLIMIIAEIQEGMFGTPRCSRAMVRSEPDCYDPRDAESCTLNNEASLCVGIFNLDIELSCSTLTRTVERNVDVPLDFLVTNRGTEACEAVQFDVVGLDMGIELVQSPNDLPMLGPGESETVQVVVKADLDAPDAEYCVTLEATCSPGPNAPTDCGDVSAAVCCLRLDSIPIPAIDSFGLLILGGGLGFGLWWRGKRRKAIAG